jgi:hypothetical protein
VVDSSRSSLSVPSSPTSSLGSRHAGLDDSQNTTITEPDDVELPAGLIPRPVSVPLTKAEIREVSSGLIVFSTKTITDSAPRKLKRSSCD